MSAFGIKADALLQHCCCVSQVRELAPAVARYCTEQYLLQNLPPAEATEGSEEEQDHQLTDAEAQVVQLVLQDVNKAQHKLSQEVTAEGMEALAAVRELAYAATGTSGLISAAHNRAEGQGAVAQLMELVYSHSFGKALLVRDVCQAGLIPTVAPNNCLALLGLASAVPCPPLRLRCLQVAAVNFVAAIDADTAAWTALAAEDVLWVLGGGGALRIDTEMQVWEAVRVWVNADMSRRSHNLPKLLAEGVCLLAMDRDMLARVDGHALVRHCPASTVLLAHAYLHKSGCREFRAFGSGVPGAAELIKKMLENRTRCSAAALPPPTAQVQAFQPQGMGVAAPRAQQLLDLLHEDDPSPSRSPGVQRPPGTTLNLQPSTSGRRVRRSRERSSGGGNNSSAAAVRKQRRCSTASGETATALASAGGAHRQGDEQEPPTALRSTARQMHDVASMALTEAWLQGFAPWVAGSARRTATFSPASSWPAPSSAASHRHSAVSSCNPAQRRCPAPPTFEAPSTSNEPIRYGARPPAESTPRCAGPLLTPCTREAAEDAQPMPPPASATQALDSALMRPPVARALFGRQAPLLHQVGPGVEALAAALLLGSESAAPQGRTRAVLRCNTTLAQEMAMSPTAGQARGPPLVSPELWGLVAPKPEGEALASVKRLSFE